MEKDLLYQLALSRVPGIGPVYAKRLIDHFGEADAIFRAGFSILTEAGSIGPSRAEAIMQFNDFPALEKELEFLEKYAIRPLFITDKDYPQRLLRCKEAPVILFYKGTADLNAPNIISVVGTRSPTEYGKQAVERLIRELAPYSPVIVSGLAYGIDAVSHKAALRYGLPTIGILGHGLDQIYPPEHTGLARKMVQQGGLLTQFGSNTTPEIHSFPLRNRIVAGMSDALVVVETATKGGSMLTVANAIDYKRKIFAFPGRITDNRSSGCNALIQKGEARILLDARQLMQELEWAQPASMTGAQQTTLFPELEEGSTLSKDEKSLLHLLREKERLSLDEIAAKEGLSSGTAAMALLNLELQGFIHSLPGKIYRLNNQST